MGVTLQRISLGALIIALGLLVDDAMITVEMMVARLEAGDTRTEAATFAYHFHRLPHADRHARHRRRLPAHRLQRQRGRRVHLQPVRRHRRRAARLLGRRGAVRPAHRREAAAQDHEAPRRRQARPLRQRCSAPCCSCAMRWRWATIGVSVALLFLSVYGMRFVQQQFFPASDRSEILVDMTLPQMSSIDETRKQMDAIEAAAEGRAGRGQMDLLRRGGRYPLLSAARPATRQRLLRADRRRGEIAGGAQPH